MKTAAFCTCLFFLSAIPFTKAGSFWYFDDLHYDPSYGSANESCLEDKRPSSPKYTGLGSYYCDAPWALVEDSIMKMKTHMATPNFIVWAGDTGHHPLTATTVLNNFTLFQAIQNVTKVLQREFPDIRVIPQLGNHDWLPKNKLPAQSTAGDFYEQYANLFKEAGWMNQEEADMFKKAGYFSTTLSGTSDKLKILVLNTNLYLKKNNVTSGDDPAGQFQFMRDQLEMAKNNNQMVYIFTHVPIGNEAIRSPYDKTFVDIITEYEAVITSMHAAHEHLDRFRLIYKDGEETPVSYQVITPAVTPWIGGRLYPRNPSFASFHYQDDDFSLQDMRLYYLNLDTVNQNEVTHRWTQLYSFRDTYSNPINVESLSEILKKLSEDEEFFQAYYRRMYVNIGDFFLKDCDETCRALELCLIRYPKNTDLQNCRMVAESSAQSSLNNCHVSFMAPLLALVWHIAHRLY